MDAQPDYIGHRDRLRDRFLSAGADGLADYELLELLLFPSIPRRDTKPLAKALIRRFGDFAGVINAEPEQLMAEPGVTRAVATALKSVQASMHRVLRAETRKRNVLSDWQRVIDYCRALMMHRTVEEFRLLFLDRQNAVIADELQQTGTLDHTPVYPREVVKRALELGAAALIMVHNHPSGNPKPSQADIQMTRQVKDALSKVAVDLHDHVIVGRDGHASLKSMGLF